jgi:hypothetical protein
MFNFFKRPDTVKELVKRYSTPESALNWVRWNIRQCKPLYGSFPTPEEVLKEGKAFCKGFAVLSYRILEELGKNPRLLTFMWREKDLVSHAITAYKDGVWKYSDNGVLHTCSVVQETLEDVVRVACPKTVYGAWERDITGKPIANIIRAL